MGTVAVSELVLPLPQRLLPSRQSSLPVLRIPDSRFEALSGLRDFFHLGLEVGVGIVHLLPFAIEGRLAGVQACVSLLRRGFSCPELSLGIGNPSLAFREPATLPAELRASLFQFDRDEPFLGLDLHVLRGSSFFEAWHDHLATHLARFVFPVELLGRPLAFTAPLLLLLEIPSSAGR